MPITFPYTFAPMSGSIPLADLDSNFQAVSTAIIPPWAVAGGAADAITVTYSPANPSLVDGMILAFRASASNATTTPTFAPDGLPAHTITKLGGSAVAVGDIPGALAECFVRYNLANTRWELMNPASAASSTPAAWTPTDASGAGLSLTVNDAYQSQIGKVVTLVFSITYPSTASGATAKIGGLPAIPKSLAGVDQVFLITIANQANIVARLANDGIASTMTFASTGSTATTFANSAMTTNTITGTFTYLAA